MSATIFVRNLPFDVTQDALEKVFGEIGPVKKVDVIKDKGKKKSETTTRGFAFVRFAMASDAEYAIEKLHQSDFRGRKMLLEIAKEKGKKGKAGTVRPPERETLAADEAHSPTTVTADENEATEAADKVEEAEIDHTDGNDGEDDLDAKKEKKDKKTNKKKKKDQEQELERAPVEEAPITTELTKAKKDKKKKKQIQDADGSANAQCKLAEVDDVEAVPGEATDGHMQSERNARRRMHREFLRQVEARKEASASADQKSVLVYGIGSEVTQKALYKKVKKIAPVVKVELKEEAKTGKKFAVVEFAKLKDVEAAVQKLDAHIFKGATLKAVRLEEAQSVAAEGEGQRLIVRNLSFQTTDADLAKLFEKYGPIVEAKVVRLSLADPENAAEGAVGKSRGFGFVQYQEIDAARNAIERLNGHKLKGREMIVDFALSKAKYLQQQKSQVAELQDCVDEECDTANDDEDTGEFGEGHGNELEMDEDDDDDAGSDEEMDEAPDEDEDVEEEEDKESVHQKEDSDEQRFRTIFLRNLSFQTTEEGMKEFFSTFGPVEYARIVIDKGSGLSKGVGFVRFKQCGAAEAVLARGQTTTDQQGDRKKSKKPENVFTLSALADGDALTLDGRMLIVSRAVAKDDADRLTESNSAQRKKQDKRNMYLAYEGTINVNKVSDEELGLPKLDIEKRRRAIREKKEKLKNPMYFVSPTRLSVRNLGASVDEKDLKKLFHDAAVAGMKQGNVDFKDVKADFLPTKPEKAHVKVKMAKVVRDMDNVKPGKEPRSRGYAFVEFVEHIHALAALRVLNNNPQYASFAAGGGSRGKNGKALAEIEKSRLIIEFALENHGKLKLREKKQTDAQKKREEERMLKEAQGDTSEKGSKKSRGQRQREKKKLGESSSKAPTAEQGAVKQKAHTVTQAKTHATKTTEQRQQKKRKRPEADDLAALALGDAGATGQKTLSRKQRKHAKERREEASFDALVRNYKQEIFGSKAAPASSAGPPGTTGTPAAERWFD